MTNNAYAKNNGDGLLCSILCQGGEIVVKSRGSRLVSGNYHEDLGPVASFWRQQT